MGRLAILLPLLALLVMSAHSALGTPLESTFIATQGDTLAVGGRGQLAHDPNVLQELLWDLEAAKPAACRTTRLPPRRQLTVQTDNLFAWNNGIFLLGVGAVSQNGSVGVLNNTIIDPALLANQSGLFLAPGTPGIPPAVLTYLPPSVTLAAVRLNLADLKTKGYTPPANIPPRLNISIPPGAIIDPAQNPSYNLSLLDVSNIRTVSVVWATWSQQIPYALSPNASSNTTSLQVFVGDPVPAGAGPQPGEPGSELNITFPVSGANATIPIYPLFTGNLSCSVYNWQTLQVNQTTVNAPAGANYSGANASVGIPCNTRALGTANGYFLLTANRLTCDYGPLKYNPCNCPYCASHPFDKNCGEFCANNPGNQCCVCANIDATATDRPAWCPSPLPPRCQEPGHVLTNTTDKCCKGRPEVFPGAGLCCVGRGDDCGSHDVDFPVWAIVLISVFFSVALLLCCISGCLTLLAGRWENTFTETDTVKRVDIWEETDVKKTEADGCMQVEERKRYVGAKRCAGADAHLAVKAHVEKVATTHAVTACESAFVITTKARHGPDENDVTVHVLKDVNLRKIK